MATVPAAPTSATLAATLAVMGWQVQRSSDGLAWSTSLMWLSVLAGLVATVCVLGRTSVTTDNARRLVEPASRVNIPDPAGAVHTWIAPSVSVAVAVGARRSPVRIVHVLGVVLLVHVHGRQNLLVEVRRIAAHSGVQSPAEMMAS